MYGIGPSKDAQKKKILREIDDTIQRFAVHDRKTDHNLPPGSIEDALIKGEITMAEMVAAFESSLKTVFRGMW